MRRVISRSALGAAAVLGAAALAASGCGGGGGGAKSTQGVTKTSVTIGSHQPLTGPAAPGYSEIAPGSNAFFQYLNAQGGVNGRKIKYIYKDDAYNPTKTVDVVKQLVLQNKVFAIFDGLGTPTHTKVLDFLNASKVPDLFVASGCPCWDDGGAHPQTFGWQPSYKIEGKLFGQYIKQHFAGKKIGVFYQDDDFGNGGLDGLKTQLKAKQIVAAEPYQPGNTNVAPQITKLKEKGAEVLVDFTIPAYTSLGQLASLKLGYKPQLMVSNVGIDPTTVGGLLKEFSKGKASTALIEGAITNAYLPSPTDTSNPWIKLFRQIHAKYDKGKPFDGNAEYGMAVAYTFAQALKETGKNPTRQKLIDAVQSGKLSGPGLVPFRYTKTVHGGYGGAQIATIKNGKIVLQGTPLVTNPDSGPIKPYTKPQPAPGANGVVKP
jgi:ABC-type branched-subunit amino acid transport system substrate-binding protein